MYILRRFAVLVHNGKSFIVFGSRGEKQRGKTAGKNYNYKNLTKIFNEKSRH